MKSNFRKNMFPVLITILSVVFICSFAPLPYPATITASVASGNSCNFQAASTGLLDIFFAIGPDGFPFWSTSTSTATQANASNQYICNNNFATTDSVYFLKKSDPIKPKAVAINDVTLSTNNGTSSYNYMGDGEKIHLGMSWDAYNADSNFVFLIVYYRGLCANGNISVTFNSTLFSYLDNKIPMSWVAPGTITSNTRNYSFSQNDNKTRVYYIKFKVNPGIAIGANYQFSAAISGCGFQGNAVLNGSITGNPHDPNRKVCDKATFSGSGQTLKYTVFFQNDGNDFATNVQVTDELDPQRLNIPSFTYTPPYGIYSCQHPVPNEYKAIIRCKKICLPGLHQQYPRVYSYNETIGSVSFKIQTRTPTSDIIQNRATIEFFYVPECCGRTAPCVMGKSMGTITTGPCNIYYKPILRKPVKKK